MDGPAFILSQPAPGEPPQPPRPVEPAGSGAAAPPGGMDGTGIESDTLPKPPAPPYPFGEAGSPATAARQGTGPTETGPFLPTVEGPFTGVPSPAALTLLRPPGARVEMRQLLTFPWITLLLISVNVAIALAMTAMGG